MQNPRSALMAVATVLLVGLVPSPGTAQLDPVEIQQIKASNPGARIFESADGVSAVYGTQLSTGATPERSAFDYLQRWKGLFARDAGDLVPVQGSDGDVLIEVMPDDTTGAARFHTFRFQQEYRGVPVFRKGVGFLTRNEPGHPLVMSSFNLAELQGVELNFPRGGAVIDEGVRTEVLDFLSSETDSGPLRLMPVEFSEQQYVVWAGIDQAQVAPRPAVSFVFTRGSVQTVPFYEKYRIVADLETGAVLLSENLIHNISSEPRVDVFGTVQGNATDGIRSADCDPVGAKALPWAEVSILGGSTAYTDADGVFTIPHGGSSAVTVRSRLSGRFFEVRDQAAGNSVPQIDSNVTPPGPADFLHNPSATEFSTSNVNVYLEANVIRDWVLSFQPNFPTIANQLSFRCNTNIDSSCNAFYDGSSINFFWKGGGCMNTGMSDVIYHEYGHHLINVTGNGQSQLGEGSGDTVGVLIQDDPTLAAGWSIGVCSSGLRNADNNVQYPCSGPIHSCGNLISGCVWDVRNELIVTEPVDYRDINSALFIGMLIVRGQQRPGDGTIDPFITILYLTLDDNDADIGNGTPHYQEIATGFGAHSMDAPPLDLLQFTYPTGRPAIVDPAGEVEFNVIVSGLSGFPLSGSGVLHVDRGLGFESFPMNETVPNTYEAKFPHSSCGTELRYYVSADTLSGATDQDPSGAPGESFTAVSAVDVMTLWEDDFETSTGWSVSGNASDGQWERGVPAGGGGRGDPPADADGSGNCYLTDNVSGNSDIDGGSTILTSPRMDASASCESVISYSRWFSNDFGNAPYEDTMVVEISNDDGATWVLLEVVGPTGPEVSGGWFKKAFRIQEYLAPTDQMRLRFTASDLGDGSVVEAGVDGVKLEGIDCGDVIVLSANPPVVQGGDTLTVGASCGDPTRPLLLFTWEVDGVPFTQLIFRASFDSAGQWQNDFSLPPGLPSTTVGLRAIGFAGGDLELSNIAYVTLQ